MLMPTERRCLGNCLLCALWLRLRHGGRLRWLTTKGRRHWYVQIPSGQSWHFKRERGPRWLFIGRFLPLGERKGKS